MPSRRSLLLPLALAACTPPPSPAPDMGAQPGCDTRFRLVNLSRRAVTAFLYSPSAERQWGTDRLGDSVLPAGGALLFRAASGGNHDFRIRWEGGGAAELLGVDICRAADVVVTDSGMFAR